MCFDCLLAFPPFSSSSDVGAKKALNKTNNTTADDDVSYGPPLEDAVNQEDLPEKDHEVDVEDVKDDGFGDDDSGTYESSHRDSMDKSTDVAVEAVALVDEQSLSETTKDEELPPLDENYVYEQPVDFESSGGESIVTGATTPETLTETDGENKAKELEMSGTRKVIGHLEIRLEYDESGGRLKVSIMKADGLANKKEGGFNSYRVRLSLQPHKQQSSKTHVRPVDSLVFNELFRFRQLPKNELATTELIFKLQGCSKYSKEKLAGNAALNLSALKAAAKHSFRVPLVQHEVTEE